MRLALDTNRYVDFCRGRAEAVEPLRQAERIYLPFAALAKLRAGFFCGQRARQNEQTLLRFLNSPRVQVLFPDGQTTHHYARLYRQLREQGTPIPAHDLWIAALVIQHDLMLLTRDRHFDSLPQLPRL